jgi:threonine dehydrogenase-like Zn-dependent dehydrogenase
MSTDNVYIERGISLRHGYMTEFYVDDAEFLVKVPKGLSGVGILLEPASVIEKGIAQAFEIQRRMSVWRPRKAAVLGAGPIGLLAALALRRRGIDVSSFGLVPPPYRNSALLREIGAHYQSTAGSSLTQASVAHGPFDLVFEATGYAPIIFEAMNVLGRNGVLVLASVTGGGRTVDVPVDRINLGFVLGNKVMVGTVSASRSSFEEGVQDLSHAELEYPGWLARLLTHTIKGLEHFQELLATHATARDAIKVTCEVAPPDPV